MITPSEKQLDIMARDGRADKDTMVSLKMVSVRLHPETAKALEDVCNRNGLAKREFIELCAFAHGEDDDFTALADTYLKHKSKRLGRTCSLL